jgi:hypothetical protein
MWILSTYRRDLLWLYLPGACALLLSFRLVHDDGSAAFFLFAFLAQGFFDSGHVYTTVWRTYFDRTELRRRRWLYGLLPLFVFGVSLSLGTYSLKILGAVVLYATIYHNIRQFYGLSKWYQRLSGHSRPWSDRFLYLLCAGPFFMAHFRPGVAWPKVYLGQDLLVYRSTAVYSALAALYIFVMIAWALYEWRLWQQNPEPGRIFSVGFPALLYGLAFVHGRSLSQILFPLVVSHGCTYLVLTAVSMKRIGRIKFPLAAIVGAVLTTALIFGAVDALYGGGLSDSESPRMTVWIALFLTPLFCHYIFDGFLWTRRHPDAARIYGVSV